MGGREFLPSGQVAFGPGRSRGLLLVGENTVLSLFTMENLLALVTLTSLEIVLGIDNIVFLAILAGRLPPEKRDRARTLGLLLAVVSRLLLLLGLGLVMKLTYKFLIIVPEQLEFSGKDLILLLGGLFLIGKATFEIHHRIDQSHAKEDKPAMASSLGSVLLQVVLLDVIFSLDSVITAIGMARSLAVMVAAVLLSVAIMLYCSAYVIALIEKHPAIKILALAFLLLIGVLLVAEGLDRHLDKGYIYFAMAFSLVVEILQIKATKTEYPTTTD